MHLKPINRQGKKRHKLKTVPALSCGGAEFSYPMAEQAELSKSIKAQTETKKDKAAA